MFWNNFYQLCQSKNKTPLNVTKELKLASGNITSWKNGTIPNKKTLEKLSSYFDVPKEYFFIPHDDTGTNQTFLTKKDIFIAYQNDKAKAEVDAMSIALKAITEQTEKSLLGANALEQTLLEAFRASTDAGRMTILEAALKAKMANEGSEVAQKKES